MAFRELVLEHSHAMFRLAWRLCGDESAADDIVQEAFLKAWRKIGDFRMQSGFRSWLHRITVNTAMDYLRKQSRVSRHETGAPELEHMASGASQPTHEIQIDVQEQAQNLLLDTVAAEKDEKVLEQAIFAISQLPRSEATRILLDLVQDPEQPREIRRQAMFWLAHSDDEEGLAALEELLTR